MAQLHNASLLVDDIEDRSTLRRGIPVAHSIYGVPVTINTANYVYFLALEQCHTVLTKPECTTVFVTELCNLHRGQGQDIQWREDFSCPTEEMYMTMIQDKTGGLFRLAIGLLLPYSTFKGNVMPLINNLSVYFQVRDDLLNLVDPDFFQLKTFAEDLTEGKFSLPVVHSIQAVSKHANHNRDTRLIAILRQKTNETEVKHFAVDIMRETKSLQYCRDMCQRYKDKIMTEIERLGGNPSLVQLIEGLDRKLQELDASGVLTKRVVSSKAEVAKKL